MHWLALVLAVAVALALGKDWGFKWFHSGARFQMFVVSGAPARCCHVKGRTNCNKSFCLMQKLVNAPEPGLNFQSNFRPKLNLSLGSKTCSQTQFLTKYRKEFDGQVSHLRKDSYWFLTLTSYYKNKSLIDTETDKNKTKIHIFLKVKSKMKLVNRSGN